MEGKGKREEKQKDCRRERWRVSPGKGEGGVEKGEKERKGVFVNCGVFSLYSYKIVYGTGTVLFGTGVGGHKDMHSQDTMLGINACFDRESWEKWKLLN